MGVDRDEALQLARAWLERQEIYPDDKIILDGPPKETEFGWVFFYNSEHYLKTGDVGYALAGNAPIVVMKSTGEVRGTGSAEPLEANLDKIRASLHKN